MHTCMSLLYINERNNCKNIITLTQTLSHTHTHTHTHTNALTYSSHSSIIYIPISHFLQVEVQSPPYVLVLEGQRYHLRKYEQIGKKNYTDLYEFS